MTDALPLEKLLAEVDSVVADLEAATPRLTLTANYGERTSSGSKTAPAPVNIDAGTCQTPNCQTELWTTQGSDDARCKTCGTEYTQIRTWRTQARTYAQDTEHNIVAYPQALAERLARIHGETIGADYIRVLAARGILKRANPERGSDGKKLRAMYKLGDVKELIKGSGAA